MLIDHLEINTYLLLINSFPYHFIILSTKYVDDRIVVRDVSKPRYRLFCICDTNSYCFSEVAIEFGYSGVKGPDKWGSLDPKFKACSDGKAQSPIDIVKSKATHLEDVKGIARDYQSANATFVNNGFNIGVSYIRLMALNKFSVFGIHFVS